MKPINLKIKGINSYVSEQEICFDKLAETNLFGIFGETGSGKTTILDAIVIALYGTSDRETIPNIINVNCKEAHIIFRFEMIGRLGDSKVYEVSRNFSVKKNGVKSDAILVDDKNKVLADMTDKVNDKILEIIGVGKKEFLKCIALPQGEFDRFLLDTPANRKKTIAKLFNLEHFGAILQDKLKQRKDTVTLQKLNVQDKIGIYGDVSEEKISLIIDEIGGYELELQEVSKKIAESKVKYEQYCSDFESNSRLIDAVTTFTMKKSELSDVNYFKKQVEYTEKYGDFIILESKRELLEKETDDLKTTLTSLKSELTKITNEIDKNASNLSDLIENKKAVEDSLKQQKFQVDRYNELSTKIDANLENKAKCQAEMQVLIVNVAEIKDELKDYKLKLDQLQQDFNKMQKSLLDNVNVLDKIHECRAVQTTESFIDYLNYLKNIVTSDALDEVYQYDIYDQVNEIISSVEKYELDTRKGVSKLKKDYDAMLQYSGSLEDLQAQLESKNHKLRSSCDSIQKQIEASKRTVLICETQISEKQLIIQEHKDKIKELVSEIAGQKLLLRGFKNIENYKKLENQLQKIHEKIDSFTEEKPQLLEDKNNIVVNIEVSTVLLTNRNEQLKEINKEIKKLGISTTEKMDEDLHLDEEKLAEYKTKIEVFDKEYSLLQDKVKSLKLECKHPGVTKSMVKDEALKIANLQEQEKALSVNVALKSQVVAGLMENLAKVTQLKLELDKIVKKYDTIITLQGLISNNSLLDYVSEEYMQLIAEFANKYVYNISRGKYLLKYNGEFFVLDNFNCGVARGVKTLSGGERFIISLSLALGISQSIAVNNNRNFNFFFIDEGFGSLSEGYVENVLESFDSLIKLKFTVGFITHVEKMQNFINNRIIVEKKNNDEGSVIKQYY